MLILELRVVLACLACYRLSQLVALDGGPLMLFGRLRRSIGRKAAMNPSSLWSSVAELLGCPYCLGVWFAAPLLSFVVAPAWTSDLFLLWWGIAGTQAVLEGLRNASE